MQQEVENLAESQGPVQTEVERNGFRIQHIANHKVYVLEAEQSKLNSNEIALKAKMTVKFIDKLQKIFIILL